MLLSPLPTLSACVGQRIVSMKFNAGVPHNVGEYVGEIKGGLPDGQVSPMGDAFTVHL